MACFMRIWTWSERHPWWMVAILVVAVRLPSLQNKPYSYDECIFATQALDWAHGGVPCVTTWDSKPPTFIALYRLAYVIAPGRPYTGIHILLCLATIGLCGALASVGGLIGGRRTGCTAALVAVFMLNGQLRLGAPDPRPGFKDLLAGETEIFAMLFVAVGLWLALRYPRLTWAWLLSGLFYALAAQMRQASVLFVIVPVAMAAALVGRVPHLPRLAALGAGTLIGAVPLVAWYAAHGALSNLGFCLVLFPRFVNSRIEQHSAGARLFAATLDYLCFQGVVVALAIPCLLGCGQRLSEAIRAKHCRVCLVLLGWLGIGVLSVGLTGNVFSHYYVQLVPPLALLAAMGFCRLWSAVDLGEVAGESGASVVDVARSSHLTAALAGFIALALLSSASQFVYSWRRGDFTDMIRTERAAGAFVGSQARPGDSLLVWASPALMGQIQIWSGLKPAQPDVSCQVMARAAVEGGASSTIGPKPPLTGALYRDAAALQDYIGNVLVADPPRFVVKNTESQELYGKYPFIEAFVESRYRLIHTEGKYEVYELAHP